MNLKKRLKHLAYAAMQNSDEIKVLLAKISNETQGVLLTDSHEEAARLERRLGVTSRSIDVNLEGFKGPFFFDNEALHSILMRAANKIEELDAELKALKEAKTSEEVSKIYRGM